MSKYRKISMTCLYAGVLMALMALDWVVYAWQHPDGSFVLLLSSVKLIYGAFLAVMLLCFALALLFHWKANPGQTEKRDPKKRK